MCQAYTLYYILKYIIPRKVTLELWVALNIIVFNPASGQILDYLCDFLSIIWTSTKTGRNCCHFVNVIHGKLLLKRTILRERVYSYSCWVCRRKPPLLWNNWNGSGSCWESSCKCHRLRTACCVACTSSLSSWCRCRESWSECWCLPCGVMVTDTRMHLKSFLMVPVQRIMQWVLPLKCFLDVLMQKITTSELVVRFLATATLMYLRSMLTTVTRASQAFP